MNEFSPHPEALGHFLHEEPWHESVLGQKQETLRGYFIKD